MQSDRMRKEECLVSIVVPVYNAEPYLRRCLDSLCGQTYHNIEIILIDDGSVDGSGGICDEYAQTDPRIRAIHKQNEGVSAARNDGIVHAGGEYLIFVDSDDYVHRELVELYMKAVEEDAVVVCDITSDDSACEKSWLDGWMANVEEAAFERFIYFYSDNYVNSPVNKLFRMDIIKRYGIRFPKDKSLGEDLLFNLDYFRHFRCRWKFLHCPLYCYENHEESLSTAYRADLIDIQKECADAVRRFLEDTDLWNADSQKIYYGLYWDRLFLTARMGWEHERRHRGKGNLETILKSGLWEDVWKECRKRKLLTIKRRLKWLCLRLLYRYTMLRRIWKSA